MLTRRALIENAAKGGLALGAGGLLAACGSTASTTSTASSSSSATLTPKHGGALHVGMTGGSSSDSVDPNTLANYTDFVRAANIYDPLVWTDANAVPQLRVAEEFTPNKDATVWTIRLRKGVLFHDGREATADDLISSIWRVYNPKSPGEGANMFNGLDFHGIKKQDRYTIAVPFTHPYSTFFESVALASIALLPTNFNPKHPVGTGPFRLASFTPGQQTVLARNANYWNHPLPYLDEVIMTDYSDETSQVNALLGGQLNAVGLLSQATAGTVASSGKKVVVSPGGGWEPFTMRVDAAPFTDVRVRQAFRLIVDREKMNRLVFGGHGTIGNDVFAIWSADYDHALPQRQQDIAQARHLLKAAGQESLTITLVTSDIAQGAVNMAQLFAQDAAQAGVTVNLHKVTPTEFFGPNYLKWQFAQDVWAYQPYLPQVQGATLPTSPFNDTHWNNPQYTKLYYQALGTTDVARRTEIVHDMQRLEYEGGGYIIPLFPPVIDGYAPNVQGAVKSKTGISFNFGDFAHMWLS